MAASKIRDIVYVALLVYLIPLLSSCFADTAIGWFADLDPDGVFAWGFLHHIAQAALTIAVIAALSLTWKRTVAQWGLNLNNSDWSMRVFWRFCLGCAVYGVIVNWLLTPSSSLQEAVSHPATARSITGNLLFMFTMPGISEELLFRSLTTAILDRSWKGEVRFPEFTVSSADVISAIVFSLAHIGFTVSPFRITHLDPVQLTIAFALGIFYSVMYRNTGSLLGPILAHNASDGLLAAISYVARFLK
ncbi:MAG: CPBP family intramembrane glutamic endopeptidase [Bacillota bacterium]